MIDTEKLKKTLTGYLDQNLFRTAVEFIVKEVCINAGWEYGEAWLPDKDNRQMHFYTSWDNGNSRLENYKRFSKLCKFGRGIGLIGKVWEIKSVHIIADLSSEKLFLRDDAARNSGLTSGYGIPLYINGSFTAVTAFFTFSSKKEDEKIISSVQKIFKEL
jgi:hypothetical protein